jgi:hypothetical protein
MKRWFNLNHDKPWDKQMTTNRKIHPDEYMQAGWDQTPSGCHPYQKGSRHNKIGMWIMWSYYVIIIGMVIRLVWVLNT